MSTEERVNCPQHGVRRAAFVCRHLVSGSGLGFYTPNQAPSGEASGEQSAWCGACERVRRQQRGWSDASEAFAGITVICDGCFEQSRHRNTLGNE